MSLRSLLLPALLLAALAAAQWSDILYVQAANVTVKKLCAVDDPRTCVYFPQINASGDPRKTIIYTGRYYEYPFWPGDFNLLQVVVKTSIREVAVYVPSSGYIYAPSSFTVNGLPTRQYYVCNATYSNAFRVDNPGYYGIAVSSGSVPLPIYWLDTKTCWSYRLADLTSRVINTTVVNNKTAVLIFYMPTSRAKYVTRADGGKDWFNGTAHIYYFMPTGPYSQRCVLLMGYGYYVANNSYVPTILVQHVLWPSTVCESWLGPRHHSALRNMTTAYPGATISMYTIGATPGDGALAGYIPKTLYGKAELVFIADGGHLGYVSITSPPLFSHYVAIFVQRYAIGEVTVSDAVYTYNVRTIACPPYDKLQAFEPVEMTVLGDHREIEICSNRTDTLYVAVYLPSPNRYLYADRLEPGSCRRLRWPSKYSPSSTALRFFTSPESVCRNWPAFTLTGYSDGWRYYLTQDNRLVAAFPITQDALYEAMWRQIVETLRKQYNATANALQRWLQTQQNQMKNIQDYFMTQPRFFGNIKMESATSTWLKTTLQELQKWRVVGSLAFFGAVSLPAVPAAVAPAAAAAVAVAWAASRRDDDVATTAAVGGIALALFGVLMTLIYGTSSLTLVALGVIVAAAAAAWRRIT